MPFIYYSHYSSACKSISGINALEHSLGRELLRDGLRKLFDLSFSPEELEAQLGRKANGKPVLSHYPDIHFNITHCDGLAACAFDHRSVGLDAELPGYFAPILVRKALAWEEQDFFRQMAVSEEAQRELFFRFWTLKEAFVKKSGIGADTDLTAFSFQFLTMEPNPKLLCSAPEVSCWQTALPDGHILSLCYEDSEEPVRLISRTELPLSPSIYRIGI